MWNCRNNFHNAEAPPPDRDAPAAMHDSLAPRGPDGEGIWVLEECGIALAHRRLAIIDLSAAGAQPMASGDGALRIVYNGEIYNYRALRNDLIAEGVSFRSDSDTEVLLAPYVKYRPDMVRYLRGMFAFAIWDERRRGLYLLIIGKK